jgi:hypothetical protein
MAKLDFLTTLDFHKRALDLRCLSKADRHLNDDIKQPLHS